MGNKHFYARSVIDVLRRDWLLRLVELETQGTHHRDEIANVNFLYDDIVQNTIDSCINSATDRRGYVLKRTLPNSAK